jgi:hypothetical protein
MKRMFWLVPAILFTSVAVVSASGSRTLSESIPASSIEHLELDSGIGDVEIRAVEGANEIAVEVVLTPRRGGFFSSKRKAEEEVASASLSSTTKGSRLDLHIAPKARDDRRFEENWSIQIPASVTIKLDHGVGDIDIRGTHSGIEIDSGVGEVRVEAQTGDVSIDLGVGTAVVRAPAVNYASAEGEGGVGDARITAQGEKISSAGFVSHAATWEGKGNFHIEVSVGVGDAVITLN